MTGVLGFALCTFAHAQYVNNMGTLISMNIVYNVEDGGHLDVRSGSFEGVNVISHGKASVRRSMQDRNPQIRIDRTSDRHISLKRQQPLTSYPPCRYPPCWEDAVYKTDYEKAFTFCTQRHGGHVRHAGTDLPSFLRGRQDVEIRQLHGYAPQSLLDVDRGDVEDGGRHPYRQPDLQEVLP